MIFGFTSPRTVEKIIPELELLIKNYSGKPFDSSTQSEFFKLLFNQDYYEGSRGSKDSKHAARDRVTRGMKSLGFVNLDPVISITDAGAKLLNGVRVNELFTRQLLKFQLPSPYHSKSKWGNYNVKPYLELLRFIKDLEVVTKDEVAIYFLNLDSNDRYQSIVEEVRQFRIIYSSNQVGNKRKVLNEQYERVIASNFKHKFESGNFGLWKKVARTKADFIKTKKQTMVDYADALIRYLRATQLVLVDRNFRVSINPSKSEEVDFILKTIPRDALELTTIKFKEYLFNPTIPNLLVDDKDYLIKSSGLQKNEIPQTDSIEDLKDILVDMASQRFEDVRNNVSEALADYKGINDIMDVFYSLDRKEYLNPSLILEWNVWRAFVMLNYAIEVRGNFKIGFDGEPVSTAGPNMPDIFIDYDDFCLIVEVTMSSGMKQYEMEGEPVARHLGQTRRTVNKNVYCLFIAPKISAGTLVHYYVINNYHTKYYEGPTTIVPMSIEDFKNFLTHAHAANFNDPSRIRDFLESVILLGRQAEDEEAWMHHIGTSVHSWTE